MKCRLLLLFIILVSSCTSPKLALDTKKVTINQLLDYIDAEQHKITTLQASCRISVDSEEFSGNFFASVYYTKNDSLLLSVSGPFGIQAGKLFVGNERFIFYNQMTNKFYNGSIKDFEDQNFFQFPLKLTELVHIFAAKERLPSMIIVDYSIDDGLCIICKLKGECNDVDEDFVNLPHGTKLGAINLELATNGIYLTVDARNGRPNTAIIFDDIMNDTVFSSLCLIIQTKYCLL